MATVKRQIITIDEEKCDGCGNCVPSCVEGALQIIDGKARLVKQSYCDGLGACLGDCPQNALHVTTLEVEGGSAMVVEMLNDQPGNGKRLVGVIWPRGTHTWFYKMVGADGAVTREKAALIQFVQSVRHSND